MNRSNVVDVEAKRGRRPSAAMIVALVALFISLAGVSWAVVKLHKNSVTSKTIKNGQVKTADLASNAVTGLKLAPAAVTGPKLAPDSVTGASVLDGSLSTADLAPSAPTALTGYAERQNVTQQLDTGSNATVLLDTTTLADTTSGTLDATGFPGTDMTVTVSADAAFATSSANPLAATICTLRLDPVGADPETTISTVYRDDYAPTQQGHASLAAVYVGPKSEFDLRLVCNNSTGPGMYFEGGALLARAEPAA